MASVHSNTYNAAFAPASNIMGYFNHGWSLAGGFRAVTKHMSRMNSLVVGPSGSFKSSSIVIGSIISLSRGKSSMCVLDVSGELYDITSNALAKKGYTIYKINFSETSDSFNPLLLCKDINDIQKIAFLLIKNSNMENRNDPYWTASAEMALSIFIEFLVFYCTPEYCSMANLVRLVEIYSIKPKQVAAMIIRTGNESLINRFLAMNAVSEKTLQSTLATVRTAIKVFGTPALQKCSATSTIDFSTFRKVPSILYISVPLNDINFYASYSALLFEAVFKEIMCKLPGNGDRDIFCLIDEMVCMRFSNPEIVWSNIRKYGGGCMGIIQQESALNLAYSSAQGQAVMANSYYKIFLGSQPLDTCKRLEEIIGKNSFVDDKGIERIKPLMTAAEIRMLPKDKAIIIAGNEPPVLATLRPYHEHFWLSRLSYNPSYQRNIQVLTEPKLFSLDEN